MAAIGIVLLLALHIVLIFLSLSFGLSVFLILPFVYIVAMFGFISTYAAYPIIDRYMIAPYATKNVSDELEELTEE